MATTARLLETQDQEITPSCNPGFFRTAPGILKILQLCFCVLIVICSSVWGFYILVGGGWVQFVAISTFITTVFFIVVHSTYATCTLHRAFSLIEFIFYFVDTCLYLSAAVVCSVYAIFHPSIAAAAAFSYCNTFAYGVDTFLQWPPQWRESTTTAPTITVTTAKTTASSDTTAAEETQKINP